MKIKNIFLAGFLLLCGYEAVAQSVIKGQVFDLRTNETIPGASVIIKNTSTGVSTDVDGRFELKINESLPVTVAISFIGYRSEEVEVYEPDALEVFLTEDINRLDEIVVTGVAEGTTRQKLSFALTKIDNELINTVQTNDASTSLRGKVAGLRVDQSGGNAGANVYLRGAKSVTGNVAPLIVVDGFVTGLSLSEINPGDIESIEVVKGAAASALYGTRGEGGIIQVLTKKGRKERALDISIENELGFSSHLLLPPVSKYHHFKVNSDGSFALDATGNRVIDYQENGFSVNMHPYKTYYNNVNSILGTQAYYTNSASVAAVGDKYNFYLSGQNQSKGGISDAVDADTRQNVLFNLNYRVSSRVTADLTAQYSHLNTPSSAVSSRSGGLLYQTLLVEPFINLAEKDADGRYVFYPEGSHLPGQQWDNPLYRLSNEEFLYITENLLLGGKLKYRITDHLSAEAAASLQNRYYNSEEYYPIGYKTVSPDISLNNGNYRMETRRDGTKNSQLQLNYNRTTGDVDWGLAAKWVYEGSDSKGFVGQGRNLTAPVKDLGVTEAGTRTVSSSWSKTVNYGYFLNVKAAWKNKLFIDALGRLDQSSRFGRDVGTAFFPRVSLAYRITEDIKLHPVSELKLRVAYGKAGSLPPFGAKDSNVEISSSGGVSFTQNDNTDLKRAVTEETEIGFDAVLFNWLNVQFNYAFSNSTNDFISVPSFAPISGSASIYDNLGAVKSNSLELELNGRALNSKTFTWTTGITFSRVRSKITSLGDVPEFTSSGYRKAVGASTTAIYGYSIFSDLSQLETNADGYVTNTGDATKRVEDYVVNEFGVVVEKAKLGTKDEAPVFYQNEATGNSKIIGEASPDFIMGFTNTFTSGAFSLYSVFDWQKGGEKFNETAQYLAYVYRSEFTDRTAFAGKPLSFTTQVFNASQVTDYWIQSTTHVALRELSLSYKIPVGKLGLGKVLRGATFSLIGRNLFIWTRYEGVNVDGIAQDGFNYPSYRTVSGKLALNF
ncbi:MAG: SusC/RagA family TonB-linked outer membrane protein [Tannerella sp.]|jgi:TonB-linked SusC/RagA family outer membrane protein|nr:SusC/RagA family TonB-linked outer membrane protein [Tannerella sp.]